VKKNARLRNKCKDIKKEGTAATKVFIKNGKLHHDGNVIDQFDIKNQLFDTTTD